jgi:DNA polymerase III delta prime subunit
MHHAYLVEGSLSQFEALLQSARSLFGFSKEGDPDVHIKVEEKFSIEDVRDLAAEASLKSISGRALYVLSLGSISHDAQQAMLKLFEEPKVGVIFVVLTPPGSIMPTLRSRFAEYPEKLEEKLANPAATKFLAASGKERSAQITALLKDDEGVKERVRELLNGLEWIFYKKIKTEEGKKALEEIMVVRGYISDRSASLKMLLEHLAIALPIV